MQFGFDITRACDSLGRTSLSSSFRLPVSGFWVLLKKLRDFVINALGLRSLLADSSIILLPRSNPFGPLKLVLFVPSLSILLDSTVSRFAYTVGWRERFEASRPVTEFRDDFSIFSVCCRYHCCADRTGLIRRMERR